MAKKTKEIKFTQEEMNSLSNLRNSFAQLELSLGKAEMARIQLEQRQESILVSSLNEKYGAGNLNPDTGVFTPNEK